MEIFDICDENGLPTGLTVERGEAHRRGILHRTAHVWLIREEAGRTQVLLQKRSRNKDSFPGLYDTSSAGHIPAGSEVLPSALRELEEELGLRARPEDLQYAGRFRIQYEKVFHGGLFWDNEIAWVYVCRLPVEIEKLRLQKEEVEEVRWFDAEAVAEEIRTCRDRFCVPAASLQLLLRFLREGAPAKEIDAPLRAGDNL